MRRAPRLLGFTLAGGALGYLLLHPYAMVVLWLSSPSGSPGGADLWDSAVASFSTHMHSMGVAFGAFGAAVGFFWALSMHRGQRLRHVALENERRKAALQTLQQLMLILSHHLLNATMAIGGQARRTAQSLPDGASPDPTRIILEECARIERVVQALRALKEARTAQAAGTVDDPLADMETQLEQLIHEMSTRKNPASEEGP